MKSYLGFGLFDVLIKGKLDKKPDTLFMSELVDFSKDNNIDLFLITGLDKENGQKLVKEHGIDSYFDNNKIYHIEQSYSDSLSEIDKEIKEQAREKDPNYCDEYYKVYFFNNLYKQAKENTLFLGHDIWTDAYYLSKYANIDVILLKDTLSNNHSPHLIEIKDLHIIGPTFEVIKEHLEKEKKFNFEPLNNYANKQLYKEMIGSNMLSTSNAIGRVLSKHQEKTAFKKNNKDYYEDKKNKGN